MRVAIDVQRRASMTEFGKSELFTVRQLEDVGVNLVIWPVSLLRLAMGAADRALDALAADGTLAGLTGEMQHRADLYDLVDYTGYARFDDGVATFTVER